MPKNPGRRAPNGVSLKREICAFHKDNLLSTQVETAAHFNIKYNLDIDRTTVSKIINEEEKRRFIE
ncbi:7327_t:CDS:1, partial [Paraglomus occultum]